MVWLRGFVRDRMSKMVLSGEELSIGPSGKSSEFLWDVKPLGLYNRAQA